MAKWCNQGENDVLEVYLGQTAKRDPLYIGLYDDSSEPAEDATLASISEIDGSGYARIQLDSTGWTIVADLATYSQVTFQADASWGNVYGYFITTTLDGTSGLLLGVETFSDGPYDVDVADEMVKITPKIRAS